MKPFFLTLLEVIRLQLYNYDKATLYEATSMRLFGSPNVEPLKDAQRMQPKTPKRQKRQRPIHLISSFKPFDSSDKLSL